MRINNNLTSKKFNKLLVIEPLPRETGERTKYKCICDCGKEVKVDGSKLQNNHTKSCGCIRLEIDHGHNKLESGVACRNSLIHNYKGNAKAKKIKFELNNDQMIKLFESDCYYCGREPYTVTYKKKLNGSYIYTGIDRLSNDKDIGYVVDNVVPCCSKCNFIKNRIEYDEFIDWIKEVYKNLNNKNHI